MRKPLFWVAFVIFTVGCIAFSLSYYHEAFSILNVTIGMTREMALSKASELMKKHDFGPSSYRTAVSFDSDDEFQSYVELAVGGAKAFQEIIEKQQYQPFTWTVRHFTEGETNETTIRFSPDGLPYEFTEILPEDQPGKALESDAARIIAERSATMDWNTDFSLYSHVETSQIEQVSGRKDHTFEYERPDLKVGDAPCRLKLVVSGDKVSEIEHYMKVPETFTRRYKEMRSANNTIALVANVALAIVYILGGCIGGLFFLMKRRYVIWRQPLAWAMFVSFVSVLAQINFLPLSWMNYDTALTEKTFLLQQAIQLFNVFVLDGLLLFISFMAAESLTRLAFGNHIQLWRVWSNGTGSSKVVLGMTVTGYLLIFVFLAYEILLQFVGRYIPGWWSPSFTLTDPNILASWFPWFTPVGLSLHAGFWEECLFRAVPLASAVLLGRRFGYTKLWIVGAFILQMLIFGAGHANYPAQPSYARVVELLIPSLTFGVLYFFLGLLPAIIMHFAFDVLMIGLPIFAAEGLWTDKVLMVLVTLIPLFIIIYRRWQQGYSAEVPESLLNKSWQPHPKKENGQTTHKPSESVTIPISWFRGLTILAVPACFAWFYFTDFTAHTPPITIDRQESKAIAAKALEDMPGFHASEWTIVSRKQDTTNYQHRFIWQEGGQGLYEDLLTTYLAEPHWLVRFTRFQGELTERTEEHIVLVAGDGNVKERVHILPQIAPGQDLVEEDARVLVENHIREQYGLTIAQLKEISAVTVKQPHRRDWTFTYADENMYHLDQGQARLKVCIGGDTIINSERFIHIPEEWERFERNREEKLRVYQAPLQLLNTVLFITFVVLAIIGWSRKSFSVRVFMNFLMALVPLAILAFLNDWPTAFSRFSTAEPTTNQILQQAGILLISLIGYLSLSLIMGFCQYFKRVQASMSSGMAIMTGFSLASLTVSIMSVLRSFTPIFEPQWPDFSSINTVVPLLQPTLQGIKELVLSSIQILLIILGIDYISHGWTQRKLTTLLLFIPAGFILSSLTAKTVTDLILNGVTLSVMLLAGYLLVWRFSLSTIPLVMAGILLFNNIHQMSFNAYPGAIWGHSIASLVIILVSIIWHKKFQD